MNRARLTLIAATLACALASCGKKSVQQVPEAKVAQGTFYIDIYEEGEIEAINSINIASPNIPWRFGNLKISSIVDDGKQVQEGDTVAYIRTSSGNEMTMMMGMMPGGNMGAMPSGGGIPSDRGGMSSDGGSGMPSGGGPRG